MERKKWVETTAATADAHLISGAVVMCGHERKRLLLLWVAICELNVWTAEKQISATEEYSSVPDKRSKGKALR